MRLELKRLEQQNPQYADEWVDCYNAEREKSGIFAYVPGSDEFADYEKTSIKDLESLVAVSGEKVERNAEAEGKEPWKK